MSLVVEFMGLPACGKTTLAELLEKELRARGVDVHRRTRLRSGEEDSRTGGVWSKGVARGRAALAHPRTVALAAGKLLTDRRSWRQKVLAGRLVLVTLENLDYVEQSGSGGVYVFAEGAGQRAFVLMADGRRPVDHSAVRRYWDHMPRSDVLVYLRIPARLSIERARRRDRGLPDRFTGVRPEQIESLLEDAAGMFEALWSRARTQRPEIVAFELDATDLDAAAAEMRTSVVDAVMGLLQGGER